MRRPRLRRTPTRLADRSNDSGKPQSELRWRCAAALPGGSVATGPSWLRCAGGRFAARGFVGTQAFPQRMPPGGARAGRVPGPLAGLAGDVYNEMGCCDEDLDDPEDDHRLHFHPLPKV